MTITIRDVDLEAVFRMKHGDLDACGWAPRMRRRFGYFSPDDHYEALLLRLIAQGVAWLDVGCGRRIFPSNPALASLLSARAAPLVGVDPDPTLDENPAIHERIRAPMENFEDNGRFDIVTMRMVAEHVTQPEALIASIARALKPGGLAVVYTVNRFSPVPLMTALLPYPLHQPIKRLLWNTDPKDTFPTAFRMNTRRALSRLFGSCRLTEVYFAVLGDCRTLGRLRPAQWLELMVWRCLRAAGVMYPEQCLLGVYRKAWH